MKIYKELMYILLFSFLGEVISKVLTLPVPGSVIGMLLLFLALQFKLIKVEEIETVGHFLIDNLAILFVPAGVGVMVYFSAIKDSWWILLIISTITTGISIAFIGILVQKVKHRFESNEIDGETSEKRDSNV